MYCLSIGVSRAATGYLSKCPFSLPIDIFDDDDSRTIVTEVDAARKRPLFFPLVYNFSPRSFMISFNALSFSLSLSRSISLSSFLHSLAICPLQTNATVLVESHVACDTMLMTTDDNVSLCCLSQFATLKDSHLY